MREAGKPDRTTVAIVGAGLGGIGLGVRLKKAGIGDFVIIDSAERVGGTWWYNQYPGAEVDTASLMYSYWFKANGWSRTHARQAELHAYIEDTVAEYGLADRLRLRTKVERAVWNAGSHTWSLTLDGDRALTCRVLVSATGMLNIPRYPDLPGLGDFAGPAFHTARWEPRHDLSGRTVAVVGSGSTATQLVPELAKIAGKVIMFQREPGWIIAKDERDHTPAERTRLAHPLRYRWGRIAWVASRERRTWHGRHLRPGTPAHSQGQAAALAFIEKELGDRPDLREAVTPAYPYWGKRLIFNTTFYAALKRPNVELVPRAVTAVRPTGVIDSDGVERSADVLVLATGFEPWNYLGTMEVIGAGGVSLRDWWHGEPRAFLGMTVPNFPNLYILYGPGTNGGEIMTVLMRAAGHVVRSVRRMRSSGYTALEVKPLWAELFDTWLQHYVNRTAFATARNYYRAPTGKVVTQWPFSAGLYGLMVRVLGGPSQRGRRLAHAPSHPGGAGVEPENDAPLVEGNLR